jgi:hypothetical protein
VSDVSISPSRSRDETGALCWNSNSTWVLWITDCRGADESPYLQCTVPRWSVGVLV